MAEPTLDDLLNQYAPHVQDLARRAADFIRGLMPGATEKVHLGWKNLVFGTGPKMGDMVLAVGPLKERINIHLAGAGLPDPTGLMEGSGKAGRHVKIVSAQQLEDPALEALLRAAIAAAALPSAEREAAAGPPVSGYRAYGSRTIDAPVDRVLTAFRDDVALEGWLDVPGLEVRTAASGKTARGKWTDGTPWEARFTPRGEARSHVAIDHLRLPTEADAVRMKETWGAALARLKQLMEG
jgi:uncharacterized protein YndB with AHSA1/START domain